MGEGLDQRHDKGGQQEEANRSTLAPERTIKVVSHELLAEHGIDTIFGNPGSNELPFLDHLPDGIHYVLTLHEGAAVSMAEGYAQASGRVAMVNLHAAAGSGNGLGALTNTVYSRTPLVLTAGQQVRSSVGQEIMLSSVDATSLMKPLVQHASEPTCAEDVPRALSHAILEARLNRRPTYVSVPYDDWSKPAPSDVNHVLTRTVSVSHDPAQELVEDVAAQLRNATNPTLVVGSHVDTVGAFDDVVRLADNLQAPVWVAPSAYRLPFPNKHHLFRGVLPAGMAPVTEALTGHDLVLVLGAPVFRYHQHLPGRLLPEDTHLVQVTDEAGAAARAPMGQAHLTDVKAFIVKLTEHWEAQSEGQNADLAREANGPDRWTLAPAAETSEEPGKLHPAEVFAAMRTALPADTAYVVESTSTPAAFWQQMDLRHPGSFYWPASGGLGFGIAAAVGVQLAQPDRRTVAVIGDGSANYAITALWTAARYEIPVTFVILRNGTYGALRNFANLLGTDDVPGLDIPGIDFTHLASGYGVPSTTASSAEELEKLLRDNPVGPLLIQVDTTSTNH